MLKTNTKTALLVAALVGFTALPALAQMNSGGAMMRAPGGGQGQDGGGPNGGQGQQFEAMKTEILQRLKQAEACVQAANDPEALRACRPQRGGRSGGGPGGGGPGGGQNGDQGGPPDDSTSKPIGIS